MALILAIDEEEDSLALAKRILADEGHQVIPFARLKDAMGWLGDHVPDLVLASGGRQGEKAKETMLGLKNAGIPGSRVLLLTSPVALATVGKASGGKVRGIITEPADREELLRLVRAAVGG